MKKIKVIDLLNMLASGEYDKLPRIIKFNKTYTLYRFRHYGTDDETDDEIVAYRIDESDVDCIDESDGDSDLLLLLNNVALNDYVEVIEDASILDDKEKEYLSAVIKPFKDRVKYITKQLIELENEPTTKGYIHIKLTDDNVYLAKFDINIAYKEMKLDKCYTLEELGL